jgi:hypothetical protein
MKWYTIHSSTYEQACNSKFITLLEQNKTSNWLINNVKNAINFIFKITILHTFLPDVLQTLLSKT